MDNIVKIQHRGISEGTLQVGSSVVVESIDANELCLRVATFADAVDLRVASPAQHAADMAEMKEAHVADERKDSDE